MMALKAETVIFVPLCFNTAVALTRRTNFSKREVGSNKFEGHPQGRSRCFTCGLPLREVSAGVCSVA